MSTNLAILPQLLPAASAEALLFVLFAAGVTAMTAAAFVLWVGWVLAKGIVLIATRLHVWPGRVRREPEVPALHACPDPVCRVINPTNARYCRHCGRMLRPSDDTRARSAPASL